MPHRMTVQMRHFLHHSVIAQMGLLGLFWLLGEAISRVLHLPIPGGIVGMALVLCLLASGKISLFSMKRGAEWLLAEMLLFFVPAVLALLNHKEFIGLLGLKILIVILGGTVVVMTITALTIDMCYRWTVRHVKN
ncbi:CidA/LrgA family protein [Bartonella sp. LJL80]